MNCFKYPKVARYLFGGHLHRKINVKHLFWALVLLLGFISPAVATDSIHVVYFYNYPPFSWSAENRMQGILIDILDEALKERMNIKVRHEGFPWKRAQIMVKNGEADAFLTIPTPQRKIYTHVSQESVISVDVKVFAWKGNPKIDALSQVRSYPELEPFSVVDYIGAGRTKRTLKGKNIIWLSKMDQIPRFLSLGRADAWTQNNFVGKYLIKEKGYENIIIELPHVLSTSSFHLCVGKLSAFAKILPKFDRTLKAMKEDDTLEKIFEKYQ
jgi:polar amino acid transport system substrate-binding protein